MSDDAPVPSGGKPTKEERRLARRERRREKKARKGPLLRRIVRRFLILAGIVLVLRIALQLGLPLILDAVVAGYDLRLEYEELDLSLIKGDVVFRGLEVTPREGGEPYLSTRFLEVDLLWGPLLGGDVELRRVEVDETKLQLRLGPDGKLDLLKRLGVYDPAPPAPEAPGSTVSLASPLAIHAFRLSGLEVRLRDETSSPPRDHRLGVDLRIGDLGIAGRPTRIQLLARAEDVLDVLAVTGESALEGEKRSGRLEVRIEGLHTKPIAGLLRRLGIRPVTERAAFRLSASADAEPTPAGGVKVGLAVKDLRLESDREIEASLDELSIAGVVLGEEAPSVGRVAIRGGRGRAEVRPDGAFRIGGFDLLPGGTSDAAPAPDGPPSAPDGPPSAPAAFSVGEIAAGDLRFDLSLAGGESATELAFVLDSLTIGDLAPDREATVDLVLGAPGIAGNVAVKGGLSVLGAKKTGRLAVEATEMDLAALRGVLAAAGLRPTLRSGALRMDVSFGLSGEGARPEIDFEVANLRLTDGEELLAADTLRLGSVALHPEHGPSRVGEVVVEGIRLPAARLASGNPSLLGFEIVPPPPGEDRPALPPELVGPAATMPRFEIGSVRAERNTFILEDRTVDPPADLRIEELGATADGLVFGGDTKDEPARGKLRLWLDAPGIADRLSVTGDVVSTGSTGEIDLEIDGRGLTLDRLSPWLGEAGTELAFESADLAAKVSGRYEAADGGLGADLSLRDLSLVEGGEDLASVGTLAVHGLHLRPGSVRADRVELKSPHVSVRREADGALRLPLIRVPAGGSATAGPAPAGDGEPQAAGEPTAISVGKTVVEDLRVRFLDEAVEPSVRFTAVAGLHADEVSLGPDGSRFRGGLEVSVAESGAAVKIAGEASFGRDEGRAELTVDGSGLKPGPLAAYPTTLALQDGRLHLGIQAGYRPAEGGGRSLSLALKDLRLADGEGASSLVEAKALRVEVTRYDPGGHLLDVREVSTEGLKAAVRRDADGALALFGLRLAPAAAPPPGPAPAAAPGAPRPDPAERFRALLEKERMLVKVEALDLGLARLSFTDESRAGAEPVVLEDFTLKSRGPFSFLGDEPESRPPIELRLRGRVRPLLDSLQVDVKAAPFGPQASLDLDVDLSGVRDPGRYVAGLPESIDIDRLDGGGLKAKVHVGLRLRRNGPFDFDLSRGFAANVDVEDVAVRDAKGEVQFGFRELEVVAPVVDLGRNTFQIRTIELIEPTLEAVQGPEGISLAGVLFRTASAGEGGKAAVTAEEAASTGSAGAGSALDLRIDNLFIEGFRGGWRDVTVSPPVVFPITELDLAIRNFTTRGFEEPIPVSLSLSARSSRVDLPTDPPARRPAFDEITASGRLTLTKVKEGWAKVDVQALELSNFLGFAGDEGVGLRDGTLDFTGDWRYRSAGTLENSLELRFTDLDVSEPKGGPLETLLRLPVSLNTVLFLLKNESGTVVVPLDYTVRQDEALTAGATDKAIRTFGVLVGNAVANAPFRVAGAAFDIVKFGGSIVGIGGEEEPPPDEPPVEIRFLPGTAELPSEAARSLAALADRLDDEDELVATLEHRTGREDAAICSRRANPLPEHAREMVAYLRHRKAELQRERAGARARLQAAIAAGLDEKFESATRQVSLADRELAIAEEALDEVLELLESGSKRRSARRMRALAVGLGRARLEETRRALTRTLDPEVAARVRVRRPRFEKPGEDETGRVVISLRQRRQE